MKQILGLKALLTILFGLSATLFFGLVYPHHIHYQEQYQLFLFERSYVCDVVSLPGGVADLLGRFCTQFFLYAWAGAAIIGLLLMAIQLLSARVLDCGRWYGLTFIPAGLLWLFLLDENALVGTLWAVLLVLLAAWGWLQLQGMNRWLLCVVLLVVAPLLYWMTGPVVGLLLFMVMVKTHQGLPSRLLALILSVCLLPAINVLQHYLSVPLEALGNGVHYYRLLHSPLLLKGVWLSFVLLIIFGRLRSRWSTLIDKGWALPVSSVAMVVAQALLVWQNYNPKAEEVMSYDYMARFQQWNRIVNAAKASHPNNGVSVTTLNLALAKKGQLVDHMFEYNQNGLSGLLPAFVRDAFSPLATAEAFYQLGMINSAQRFVFEAQEAIPDYQKSGRCYKRLAETNLINGSYEVSRKYLLALQKTLFYSDWADKTLKLLGEEEAIMRHPEYGRLRQNKMSDHFFFSDRETPQMLGRLFVGGQQNRMAFEYLEASFLLTGDLDSFVRCFDIGQSLGYQFIPVHFQEALILWWSHSHGPNEKMPVQINSNIVQGLDRFYALYSKQGTTPQELARQFGNTYWYYFFTTLKK